MYPRVAAIDVGSNSMRVAVIDTDGGGSLEVVQEARAVPRLIREVRATGRLSAKSMTRVLDVIEEFVAIARSSAAMEVMAVATSAVRDAANAAELVAAVRARTGIELRVVSGEEEARLAFLGALHSLPISEGLLVDVGGGSAELVRFRARAAESLVSLQLGAVRLTDAFLGDDPPPPEQLGALRTHVAGELRRAGLGRLQAGTFVGTGGTVRNLAKVARARYGYPLPHLHGYRLTRARFGELVRELSVLPRAGRLALGGLSEDRADTIVAGALVIEALFELLDAEELVVSGQGLREGMALAQAGGSLVAVDVLREAAVQQALERFAPDDGVASARRVGIVNRLMGALPVGSEDVMRALPVAAALLDLGRGIGYYNRHRHTESILLARGVDGFTHREQALLGALVRLANSERYDALAYAPLITEEDIAPLARAGALLQLADELEQRLPAAAYGLEVEVDRTSGVARLSGDLPRGWDPGAVRKRFARAFGLNLVISGGGGV